MLQCWVRAALVALQWKAPDERSEKERETIDGGEGSEKNKQARNLNKVREEQIVHEHLRLPVARASPM